jgi:hypothetical protein
MERRSGKADRLTGGLKAHGSITRLQRSCGSHLPEEGQSGLDCGQFWTRGEGLCAHKGVPSRFDARDERFWRPRPMRSLITLISGLLAANDLAFR